MDISPEEKAHLVEFKKKMEAIIGTNSNAYKKHVSSVDPVYDDWTLEDIRDVITSGDVVAIRRLSRFFYRVSGIYRRVIEYYSNLLLYDYVLVPHFLNQSSASKIKKSYNETLLFLDKFNIQLNFQEITSKILSQGAYYGLLRMFDRGVTFQELPIEYCRSRYKNSDNIDILEFNLQYFDSVMDANQRKELLQFFPPEISREYIHYKNSKGSLNDSWVEVPAHLGIVFYYRDFIPLFAGCLPEIYRLEAAQDREADRDAEDLEKLLTVEMPISSKTDEPVFSLEETALIHEGLADMLADNRFINVLTTFGKPTVHRAQDSKGGFGQGNSSIEKFSQSLYEALGVSAQLFNAEGNTALKYSVDKDTSLMFGWARKYSNWLTYIVNWKHGDNKISYEVEFLPTTIHNRKDIMDTYLKGAQYGYSKIFTAVAQGIKQSSLNDLIRLENDILNLDETMVPLQSSHTASLQENNEKKDGKNKTNNGTKDNKSEPGRPELSDSDKSDKTIQNRDAM